MSIEAIIEELAAAGVYLAVQDGKLLCKARDGALTAERRQLIAENKADVIRFFSQAANESREDEPPMARRPAGPAPLSPTQQRLWFIDRLSESKAHYTIPAIYRLDGDTLLYKNYWHIGFAADTPNGLMVPVIRDADKKSIPDIANEMNVLAKLAREGKIKPDQMQGGTFSISSLGGIGGIYFTPIINAPEVAIMGVCKGYWKQHSADGKTWTSRLTLPLSLSWDHRVIDGAAAARFNVYFANVLADLRRVLF